MSEKIKYQIVTASELTELEEKVNFLVKKGWIPTGGISLSLGGAYVQAIYLESIGF